MSAVPLWIVAKVEDVSVIETNRPSELPVVILAGGQGTRLREETAFRPKPMVEVGGRPLLWHIMKTYDHFGFRRFIVPVGYKGNVIKEYFLSYAERHADFTVNTLSGQLERHDSPPESWDVTVVDTGLDTMTGGRVKRLAAHLPDRFMVTYGDGVADVPIDSLMAFHEDHGRLATVTAVRPPSRFGALGLDGNRVVEFSEKPQAEAGWINGGFFIFEHAVLDYLTDDDTVLEREPLERLAEDGQLMAYRHSGFWEPMDTERDRNNLIGLWSDGTAPWKVWNG
jgi:glucose-1-phosphate cytidylyltransferase